MTCNNFYATESVVIRDGDNMLFQCWRIVYNAGPTKLIIWLLFTSHAHDVISYIELAAITPTCILHAYKNTMIYNSIIFDHTFINNYSYSVTLFPLKAAACHNAHTIGGDRDKNAFIYSAQS